MKIVSYRPHDFMVSAPVDDVAKIDDLKERLKKQIDDDLASHEINRFVIPLFCEEYKKDDVPHLAWFAKAMVKFAEVDVANIPKSIFQGLGLK